MASKYHLRVPGDAPFQYDLGDKQFIDTAVCWALHERCRAAHADMSKFVDELKKYCHRGLNLPLVGVTPWPLVAGIARAFGLTSALSLHPGLVDLAFREVFTWQPEDEYFGAKHAGPSLWSEERDLFMFVGPEAVQQDVIRLISRRILSDRACRCVLVVPGDDGSPVLTEIREMERHGARVQGGEDS